LKAEAETLGFWTFTESRKFVQFKKIEMKKIRYNLCCFAK